MSRPWRIEYEGALYHVLSRGNDKRDIFYEDNDRDRTSQRIYGEDKHKRDLVAYIL